MVRIDFIVTTWGVHLQFREVILTHFGEFHAKLKRNDEWVQLGPK
jgi:hypothetical protein